jgi:hypothetical protein
MNTPTAARRSREIEAVHWSVTDGRTLVGTIDLIDGSYVAIDIHGEITGTFGTRLEAARSFPDSTSTNSGRRQRPLASTKRTVRTALTERFVL